MGELCLLIILALVFHIGPRADVEYQGQYYQKAHLFHTITFLLHLYIYLKLRPLKQNIKEHDVLNSQLAYTMRAV